MLIAHPKPPDQKKLYMLDMRKVQTAVEENSRAKGGAPFVAGDPFCLNEVCGAACGLAHHHKLHALFKPLQLSTEQLKACSVCP
eukprot:5730832-Prymnesium_polylepis.1